MFELSKLCRDSSTLDQIFNKYSRFSVISTGKQLPNSRNDRSSTSYSSFSAEAPSTIRNAARVGLFENREECICDTDDSNGVEAPTISLNNDGSCPLSCSVPNATMLMQLAPLVTAGPGQLSPKTIIVLSKAFTHSPFYCPEVRS